jgi:transposase-like protein
MNTIKKQPIARELSSDAFILYIDAYHCDIKEKNRIRKASVYVALGVDLQGNKDIFGLYACFLKYPENLRKHIYTTNPVESINSMIEKVRINLGGYFQSVDILEVNLLIQRDNLKNEKWKKPIPAFKGVSYEILQFFNKSFQSRYKIIDKSLFPLSFYPISFS